MSYTSTISNTLKNLQRQLRRTKINLRDLFRYEHESNITRERAFKRDLQYRVAQSYLKFEINKQRGITK